MSTNPPQDIPPTELPPRPDSLIGETFRIKPPNEDHALYMTVNHYVKNPGTEQEQAVPYEVFFNSKNMEHFQWVVALSRVISALFKKGGETAFIAEELKAIYDPRGGYFRPKGKGYCNSILQEVGETLEAHLQGLGCLPSEPVAEASTKEGLAKAGQPSESAEEVPESVDSPEPPSP